MSIISTNYMVCVQSPNMPQIILSYPSEKEAVDAVEEGIRAGVLRNKAELGRTIIYLVAGTTFVILSKESFEKQLRQAQLMSGGKSGRG